MCTGHGSGKRGRPCPIASSKCCTLSPGLDYSSIFSWATIIAVSNSSPTRICFYAALPTRCFRDPLRCSAGRLPPSPVLARARPAPPRAGSAGSLHLPRPRLRPLWVAADGDQRQLSLGPPTYSSRSGVPDRRLHPSPFSSVAFYTTRTSLHSAPSEVPELEGELFPLKTSPNELTEMSVTSSSRPAASSNRGALLARRRRAPRPDRKSVV